MTDDERSDPPALTDFPLAPSGTRLSLLEGVKVIDLTRFLAGPYGTMILGDLGADVVKIESLDGDSTRQTAPYYFGGDSAYFLSANRNKRSIALDLKSPEGRKVLHRLVAEADVVIDNLRSEQRPHLGVDYETLKSINPRIVSCSVTGFGSNGPYRDRPAYDIVVEALGGVMGLTGPKGGPSVRAGVPIGDIAAGMYAAIGILAALDSAKRTGQGTHIDVGMLDCQLSLLSYLAQYYFIGGLRAKQQGGEHESIVTYNTWPTSDGDLVTAANTQQMWRSLVNVLGRPELATDERFETAPKRLQHKAELVALLREETRKWTTEDLYEALLAAGVPTAPINDIEAALKDPQAAARGDIVRVQHYSGDEFLTVSSPIKGDAPGDREYLSPPELGGQTWDILRDAGLDDEEISELIATGVAAYPSRTQNA